MASTDELLAMYARIRNRPSREDVILSHVTIVKQSLARLPVSHLDREEYSELVGLGVIALAEAVDHFGSAGGPAFEAYANSHVKASIVTSLRHQAQMPNPSLGPAGADDASERRAAMYAVGRVATMSLQGATTYLSGLNGAVSLPEALLRLPQPDAMLLSLFYSDGLTLKEIGAVLEVSEPEVCALLGRAVVALDVQLHDPKSPVDPPEQAQTEGRGLAGLRVSSREALPLRRSTTPHDRRFVRVPCALDVDFGWADESGAHSDRGVAANISCGGLSLRLPGPEGPLPGSVGTIQLALPRFPDPLSLQARVVRADGSRASGWRGALMFVDALPRERDQIASYIWRRREFLVRHPES